MSSYKVRELRWGQNRVHCPRCDSQSCEETGKTDKSQYCSKYQCNDCRRHFNDLTGTIFADSKLSLKIWIGCLYLMGLNSSNRQISKELDISEKTAQKMTTKIREEIKKNSPEARLSGEVEFDEVYVVAGHKGHSEAVKKRA